MMYAKTLFKPCSVQKGPHYCTLSPKPQFLSTKPEAPAQALNPKHYKPKALKPNVEIYRLHNSNNKAVGVHCAAEL